MNKLVILFMIHFGVAFGSKEVELVVAATNGDISSLTDLLASGVNPNWGHYNSQTALHAAASNNHAVAVKVLLIAGADKDAQDVDGETPIWQAARQGSTAAAETLIQYGADVNIPDHAGQTPLMVAIKYSQSDLAKALINAPNANLNHQDELGQTALHYAVSENTFSFNIVELLLQKGANPTIRDNGMTPAERARDRGYDQVARAITDTAKSIDKRLEL